MKLTARLSVAVAITALAALVLFTALAQADTTPYRIQFFGCADATANNNPAAPSRLVPANQPLFFQGGYSSGTKGSVVAALPKIQNTFSVTAPGGTATLSPASGPVQQNPDGTWTSRFRFDLPPLAVGTSMTIHWTEFFTSPVQDLVPPSDPWDPVENFQPPWDGTGLKYQTQWNGFYDLGTCTVTAVAP